MNIHEINQLIEGFFYKLVIYWIEFESEWWWLFGLIGGFALVTGWALNSCRLGRVLSGLLVVTIIFQPLLYFISPKVTYVILKQKYVIPDNHLYVYLVGLAVSSIITFFIIRNFSAPIDNIKNMFVKRSSLERDKRTDIRNISDSLPKAVRQYNPQRYFKKNKIFIGKDRNMKPRHIKTETWRSSHIVNFGTTGAGKGVAAGVMLTQSLYQGEAICIVDPKDDEYLPHVMAQAAERVGKPYYYIDLNGMLPQWNPFSDKTKLEVEELLVAAFSLGIQGDIADVHRLHDRKSAREFSNYIVSEEARLSKVFSSFIIKFDTLLEKSKKFVEDMNEVVSLPVCTSTYGLNIGKAIQEGAVIYVKGSMRQEGVKKLQKMFVLSVMQHCENRDRESARSVCMFLDEFKYLISKPAMEALGAIRDKRAHVMLAYQSLDDLRDCPADMSPESVISSVNENCAIKLAYKVRDPDTADWLARMSGTILVDDEMRSIKTTKTLSEVKNPDRMLRQTERYLIDTNMLQSLPPRCAVLYGNGLADFIFTSPIKVTKKNEYITPTTFNEVGSTESKTTSVAENLLDVD